MGFDPDGPMPRLNDLDTVPPPDGGDAYGNATVVRAAPSEILEAIRREREKDGGSPPDASAGPVEDKVIVADAKPSESADVHIPQAEAPSIPKMAALTPEALKPARVPQDFDKLMSQKPAEVPAQAAPLFAPDDEPVELPTRRRTNVVLTVIVVLLVIWIAVLAVVAVSHFAAR